MPNTRRIIDIAVGVSGLILSGPLIILMALVSHLETGKSGFFHQRRYGLYGRPFTIYKIRTLGKNSELLPLSGWLRKRGLDELPQIINLINGDMSIVGPRPYITRLATPNGNRALDITPGIVGLNAVVQKMKGLEQSLERRAEVDVEYVNHRLSSPFSLEMDMYILFNAAKLVLAGRVDTGSAYYKQLERPTVTVTPQLDPLSMKGPV